MTPDRTRKKSIGSKIVSLAAAATRYLLGSRNTKLLTNSPERAQAARLHRQKVASAPKKKSSTV